MWKTTGQSIYNEKALEALGMGLEIVEDTNDSA
jgi:hypothetical protein